jgi:hypothetical protein
MAPAKPRNATTKNRPAAAHTVIPDPSDEYLTTLEAAKRLKRSAKTLEYWRLVGKGPPFYRQERAIRYLLSEVLAWGAGHRVVNQNIRV